LRLEPSTPVWLGREAKIDLRARILGTERRHIARQ